MKNTEDQRITRARLRLQIEQPPEATFTPPHNSTSLFREENPFSGNSKITRSPPITIKNTNKHKQETGSVESVSPVNIVTNENQLLQRNSDSQDDSEPEDSTTANTTLLQNHQRNSTGSSTGKIQQPAQTVKNMANETFADTLTNPVTPVRPKFLCPEIFNPCRGNAASFIKNYERTSAANGWTNTLKMSYFQTFLEGAAELWFKRYIEQAQNQTKTWDEIKGDFIKEYGQEEEKWSLERRLYDRKQKEEESIKSYYYDLQALFGEYDPTYNITDFKKYFENGLKRSMYPNYRLLMEDNLDWQKMNQIINKLDDISSIQAVTDNTTHTPCNCIHQACHIPIPGNVNCHNLQWNVRPGHQNQKIHYNQRQFYNNGGNQRYQNQSRPYQGSPQRSNPPRYQQQGRDLRQNSFFQAKQNNQPQDGRTQFNQSNGYMGNHHNGPPNTRTNDGRPRCYYCGRIGHMANVCRSRPNQGSHPNPEGRR